MNEIKTCATCKRRGKSDKHETVREAWISIIDRTPKEGEEVLVVTDVGLMAIAEFLTMGSDGPDLTDYWYAEGAVSGRDREIRGRITHWKPLPSPPNAEPAGRMTKL